MPPIEFKHSFTARLTLRKPFDYQNFTIINADIAPAESSKAALGGVMTLIANFTAPDLAVAVKSIEIFSQEGIDKDYLITATARVRIIETGKVMLISIKFAEDVQTTYLDYHDKAITALEAMLEDTVYAYDKVSVLVEENPYEVEAP